MKTVSACSGFLVLGQVYEFFNRHILLPSAIDVFNRHFPLPVSRLPQRPSASSLIIQPPSTTVPPEIIRFFLSVLGAACMVERSGWTTNVNTLMGMRQKFALGIMPIPIPLILQTNLGYEAWEQYILLNSGSCFFKCNKQVCSQRM
ncbi:hypothetical protein L2E82_25021 [Cichorium intybus]|uniref:Uncharacterized protein n=1 Tax=Cichorium intybus TaxID=13427 RepID=A0ACB9E1W9_CICIN|nr:hypothetical protein L2E82_25021 [Cichorium intybus]